MLMLCTPVFIFTSGSSALLGRPSCGLSIWLSLLAIFNTLFWVYAIFIHEKMDKTRKYSKSYENGRRRLLGAQSINTERASLTFATDYFYGNSWARLHWRHCVRRHSHQRWALLLNYRVSELVFFSCTKAGRERVPLSNLYTLYMLLLLLLFYFLWLFKVLNLIKLHSTVYPPFQPHPTQ